MQDYHIHTQLSRCSSDPEMTVQRIIETAREMHLTEICLTDHCWDARIPVPHPWYMGQNVESIERNLPIAQPDDLEVFFGCETEYLGGKRLGLHPDSFKRLDHVNIPMTHFHMEGLVRPRTVQTPEQYARLIEERLRELTEVDLPEGRCGIAHISFTFQKGEALIQTYEELSADALYKSFCQCRRRGIAIEINAGCFEDGWEENRELFLKIYRVALDAGCKYYLSSDAHHPAELWNLMRLVKVVEALGLSESNRYRITRTRL